LKTEPSQPIYPKVKNITIHNVHPGDQLDLCRKALNTLTYALESCDTNSFASTKIIEWSIRDAVERIEAQYKAERKRFTEAALHVSLANGGTDCLSPSEREKMIERLKAEAG
jgi:Tfp pilus assembly protein PilN